MKHGFQSNSLGVNPRILITGHTGFKGTWLTFLLEELDLEIFGFSLKPKKDSLFKLAKREQVINEKYGDIRDKEQLRKFILRTKPTVIFHLAAQPLVLDSYKYPRETFETNVMGTFNLIEIAAECASTKIVIIATTDKVYENIGSGKRFTESDSLRGADPYSASKVAAESVVDAWKKILISRGSALKIATVRSGNVVGGGDNSAQRLLPDLIHSFIANDDLIVRNPNSTRPWQHVLDPLYGYFLTADAIASGKIIESCNFGPNDKSLSVKEVIRIAKESWNGKSRFIFERGTPGLESEYLSLDSSFSQHTLGWNPRWSQEDAIRSTIAWWLKVERNNYEPYSACKEDIDELINSL